MARTQSRGACALCGYESSKAGMTELKLKVVGEREGRIGRESLRLLTRNNPPEWTCNVCGKTATGIHTEEVWESENPFYCDEHSGKAYPFLLVVNSPRMGVCGYEG